MKSTSALSRVAGVALAASLIPAAMGAEKAAPATGLGAPPPPGAVVLFDGKSTDAWSKAWKVEDGAMISGGGSIESKQEFADAMLHVEFRTPNMPDAKGQARGNSGVFLQGRYEVQVLDSFGIASPGKGDCGAIYNVAAPLVNASLPPLQWQSYDIVFRAPRFDADGKKTENARITVMQNGRVIQNNTDVPHNTSAGPGAPEGKTGPVALQDHGNPAAFRNVWLLPLPASGSDRY